MKKAILLLSTLMLIIMPNQVKAGDILDGAEVIKSSNFTGENEHQVSGEVQIVKKGDVHYLILQDNFQFDGAPDPRLGFSSNNELVEDSVFSGLNRDEGKQVYRLPADFEASNYDEVTIWCEQFSVPIGEAKY